MIHHQSLLKSFHYAWQGIEYSVRNNQNVRILIGMAIVVILASYFFGISGFEMGILAIMVLLVISAEMINTSIEEMTNLIKKEHSQEAKIAKDVSAGMVLIVSAGSFVVGVIIFIPHVLRALELVR